MKIEFKTDAIMLIPSCVLFRDAKGWAIGIGWLCWGTLIRFPNAAGQARAVASRPEPACSRLVCDQCGAEETPPYDEGDACLCGGVFRSANIPICVKTHSGKAPTEKQGISVVETNE